MAGPRCGTNPSDGQPNELLAESRSAGMTLRAHLDAENRVQIALLVQDAMRDSATG